MTDRESPAEGSAPARGSLLYVTTVAHTLHHFLIPYARHFRSLGWRVDAAARGASSDPALHDEFDHVYELPLSRSILDFSGLVRGERAVSRVLASGPDIVHVHTPIASFVTRLAASRLPADRRPQVAYAAHGFHFHQGGRAATNAIFLMAEKLAGRWTDRLIVINDEDYLAARRNRIVPASRLVRMPGIGLDTEAYSRSRLSSAALAQARRQLAVGADAPLLVVVAELNRNKRPADVIEALALMRHTEPTVVFVGPGPQAPLKAHANAKGLQDRVRFTGLVDDVRPLIAISTAVVLPSKREGLSRSIMEALALEVPVIASTARGNRELVGADSGLVYPTGDVAALAAAMDWIVGNPDEAQAVGRQGRQRMVEKYDLPILIRMHEELYRGMLAEVARRR